MFFSFVNLTFTGVGLWSRAINDRLNTCVPKVSTVFVRNLGYVTVMVLIASKINPGAFTISLEKYKV